MGLGARKNENIPESALNLTNLNLNFRSHQGLVEVALKRLQFNIPTILYPHFRRIITLNSDRFIKAVPLFSLEPATEEYYSQYRSSQTAITQPPLSQSENTPERITSRTIEDLRIQAAECIVSFMLQTIFSHTSHDRDNFKTNIHRRFIKNPIDNKKIQPDFLQVTPTGQIKRIIEFKFSKNSGIAIQGRNQIQGYLSDLSSNPNFEISDKTQNYVLYLGKEEIYDKINNIHIIPLNKFITEICKYHNFDIEQTWLGTLYEILYASYVSNQYKSVYEAYQIFIQEIQALTPNHQTNGKRHRDLKLDQKTQQIPTRYGVIATEKNLTKLDAIFLPPGSAGLHNIDTENIYPLNINGKESYCYPTLFFRDYGDAYPLYWQFENEENGIKRLRTVLMAIDRKTNEVCFLPLDISSFYMPRQLNDNKRLINNQYPEIIVNKETPNPILRFDVIEYDGHLYAEFIDPKYNQPEVQPLYEFLFNEYTNVQIETLNETTLEQYAARVKFCEYVEGIYENINIGKEPINTKSPISQLQKPEHRKRAEITERALCNVTIDNIPCAIKDIKYSEIEGYSIILSNGQIIPWDNLIDEHQKNENTVSDKDLLLIHRTFMKLNNLHIQATPELRIEYPLKNGDDFWFENWGQFLQFNKSYRTKGASDGHHWIESWICDGQELFFYPGEYGQHLIFNEPIRPKKRQEEENIEKQYREAAGSYQKEKYSVIRALISWLFK